MNKYDSPPPIQLPPPHHHSPPQQPPQHLHQPPTLNLDSKISPSIILIIIILAIIFFISGLLHLVVRFLLRPSQRNPDEFLENVTALQGQLQQLFHLHDSGVDQSYIDTLPIFQYKAIIGVKDPFDCAVCLCEFEPNDKLRLLPKCSHAFHVDCIDTWLLSHSTCPLCRASLLQDNNGMLFNHNNVVCVLESRNSTVESSMELLERENSGLNRGESELFGSNRSEFKDNSEEGVKNIIKEEKIVMVKLGKFRNVEGGEGSSEINNNATTNTMNNNNNNNNVINCSNDLGSRRCYSMGSFAYVLDETSSLQVPIRTPVKKVQASSKAGLKAGHRAAMSEYGCDSRREFNGIEAFRSLEILGNGNGGCGSSSVSKKESFSFSKIWLRGGGGGGEKSKKFGNGNEIDRSSRRAISEFEIDVSEIGIDEEVQSGSSVRKKESFSFSKVWLRGGGGGGGGVEKSNKKNGNGNGNGNGNEIGRSSRRTISEFDVSEIGIDEEVESCYSVDSLANPTTTTSSTRRTLLWLMGRQNKMVHNHSSSFSSNI